MAVYTEVSEGEAAAMLHALNLGELTALVVWGPLMIGGTVYAIDLSAAMLDYVGWKAQEEGLANIVCRPGGFLTYAHDGPPFDVLHTSLALHRLADFWKQSAVERFTREFAPLVTSGFPGTTGYTSGRPPVREWRSIVVGKPADLGGEVCRGAG